MNYLVAAVKLMEKHCIHDTVSLDLLTDPLSLRECKYQSERIMKNGLDSLSELCSIDIELII